jgi:multidrug efflux pump subunit AcrA (membrane-fusion protein)
MNTKGTTISMEPMELQQQASATEISEALAALSVSRWRRWLFQTVRFTLAGGLATGGCFFVQRTLTKVESDQAYLNTSVTSLRAPIAGQLQIDALSPGAPITRGTDLFSVENQRFNNLETMPLLELVDRLRAELSDTELRLSKQEQIFQLFESLYKDNLTPKLRYLEEETFVSICRKAVEQKVEQLHSAEQRVREVEQLVTSQRHAAVTMPFDGVVWAIRAQNGCEVGRQEAVAQVIDPKNAWVEAFINERHVDKFTVGTLVNIRTVDGKEAWNGRVESVRAGVGRLDPESFVALPSSDLTRRRIAVRVRSETPPPFSASQFFGVGRSVVVSLPKAQEESPSMVRISRE